jgi:probable rRNA maturation factor
MAKHAPLVRRVARASLRHLGEQGCELSIALVGDEEMRRLNRGWRGKDRTTDVLSFSLREGDGEPPAAAGLARALGDVVLAVPTAERQARQRGHALERELAELLVHGVLHLLGYDHERSPAEARRMYGKQREVLAAIGERARQGRRAPCARPRRVGYAGT